MSTTQTENIHRQQSREFVVYTVIAAVVASLAAWGSDALGLENWIMFAGFIAWFTRPTSLREGCIPSSAGGWEWRWGRCRSAIDHQVVERPFDCGRGSASLSTS